MILRVFRARAKTGKVKELEAFLHEQAVPLIRGQKGCREVYMGRPLEKGAEEFVLVTTWATKEDLIAFAGTNWRKPKILPSEAELIASEIVDHYEIVPIFGKG